MRKPTICIGENKAAEQLCSNCKADQRLCFRCTDSTILLLLISEISSVYPASVTVQAGLCQTLSGPKLLVFSRAGSIVFLLDALVKPFPNKVITGANPIRKRMFIR